MEDSQKHPFAEPAAWFWKAILPRTQQALQGASPSPTALQAPGFLASHESFEFLLKYAERIHAVLPLAAAIERSSWFDELREPTRRLFEKQLRRERMVLALLDDEFDFTFDRLRRAGIPCALLKGMDIGRRFYPERIFRPMTDVDLLVPYKQFHDAIAALREAGYEIVGEFSEGRFRVELGRFPGDAHDGPVVEIHKFLQEGDTEESIQAIWGRCKSGQIPGLSADVLALAPEDLIPYLTRHAGVQHLVDSAVWLNDLHYLATSRGFRPGDPEMETRWKVTLEGLVARKSVPAAWFLFLFLNRFYGTQIPESVMGDLKARITPMKARLLESRATPSRLFPPDGRSITWTATTRLLLRQGPREAWNYAVRRLKAL